MTPLTQARAIIEAGDVEAVARLVEALDRINVFANDTLSGRADGPDDRKWQRDGVLEIARRSRLALATLPAAKEG